MMKTFKYSLAALLVLSSSLSFIQAETASKETAKMQNSEEMSKKVASSSTGNTFLDALQGTTISGYVYGQMTSQFGADVKGNVFRTRAWLNLDTKSIHGFNISTQVRATMGGGSNNSNKPFLSASGDPAVEVPILIQSLRANLDLTEQGSKTVLMGGKMGIQTSFNDTTYDRGYGIYLSNEDLDEVKLTAQVFGAYSLDDDYSSSVEMGTSSYNRPLYIVGIEMDKNKTSGVGLKFYGAHSTKVFNYMVMGDLSYSISGITLQGQVAATEVYQSKTNPSKNAGIATTRGLYNVQLSYALQDIGLTATGGFTGSFGDGYGALLNYASFNMGGQVWYDFGGKIPNGYGLNGAGSKQGSDIMVGYAGFKYSGIKSFKLGLDYAYVAGNNNFQVTPTASKTAKDKVTQNHKAVFHEVSVTASYGFIDNKVTLSGLFGSTFGDLEMMRARVKLNYAF